MTTADWLLLFATDPRPWLRDSDQAPALWIAATTFDDALANRADDLRRHSVASPEVRTLIELLPPWGEGGRITGHDSPTYLPNILHLLADLGVRARDDDRVDAAVGQLLEHQTVEGRFQAFGRRRGGDPVWGSLPCDTHAITDVLLRFGHGESEAVHRALTRMSDDFLSTLQGPGWTCIPDPAVGFRGPGRRGDLCPQVTAEAVRAFGRLEPDRRPVIVVDAARTLLAVWRRRAVVQPYMFGHGYRFKVVKWPPIWYRAFGVLDALAAYPEVWRDGRDEDRRSIAELLACLIAYNVDEDGRVVPRSCYRGFEQIWPKGRPSFIATAMVAALASRYSDIAPDAADIDVTALESSKGGSGVARPPA